MVMIVLCLVANLVHAQEMSRDPNLVLPTREASQVESNLWNRLINRGGQSEICQAEIVDLGPSEGKYQEVPLPVQESEE